MTKQEIFENFFLNAIYFSDTILNINSDGEDFSYIKDYVWSIKEIESLRNYMSPEEFETDIKQYELEQEKINTFEAYLRTLKIDNINVIVDILPKFIKTLDQFQKHDLSQIGFEIGCTCGCGGDKITQKDYDDHDALKLQIETYLRKVEKLLY